MSENWRYSAGAITCYALEVARTLITDPYCGEWFLAFQIVCRYHHTGDGVSYKIGGTTNLGIAVEIEVVLPDRIHTRGSFSFVGKYAGTHMLSEDGTVTCTRS